MVGLSAVDIAILEAILRYETHPVVEDLADNVFSGRGLRLGRAMNLRNPSLPTLLGLPANDVRRSFASVAPLIRSGLVQVEDDQDVSCVSRLHRLVSEVDDHADVRELLLGDTRESDLEWSDFDHLAQSRDDVERMLRGALDRGVRGVNILVHGPPGTGKTEFCRVLAHRLGVNLFSIGEADECGDEPTRRERLSELTLAQSLLGDDQRAVLLFDEMEDLLCHGGFELLLGGFRERRSQGVPSKVFMNRLLEETPTPTLWTTNIADSINPAILRRMMFALEMRQPPARIRSRIWSRQLSRHGIDATEEDAAALAHEFDATPGVAAGATAAADLADGDFETVRRGIRSLSRVLGCERPNAKPVVRFDPSLIEADLDVEDLVTRLEAGGQRRFSLCLQGPPGSGKSAYVRHLADRLGLEVLHKRTSDLLSMWVGGTERNIANAFAEARDDNAFLVFDEADSLLADRRGAHRSWEVSQVNEMLTWMESHPLPFACTTNFGDNLDSAALRRFVFKVTLGYLKAEAAASAFRAFFGLEPPIGLGALAVLTPGDFEVVRRKAGVLGQLSNPDALMTMLRAECEAKPGGCMAIGFGR
ncbi:MAG: AAA family ATPase [Gammaproteobacteria bacterium]|nr:AAA family ATPase [Gammaproteobacteria bacterium]